MRRFAINTLASKHPIWVRSKGWFRPALLSNGSTISGDSERARDALWLLDQGFTVHDGRNGVPTADASARWRTEQEVIISEINALLELYDSINLHRPAAAVEEASS